MDDAPTPAIPIEDPPLHRDVFGNRTLNLRSIKAVGYDMDYTLVHYDVRVWEERAWAHMKRRLADRGLPVQGLEFDPDFTIRGLILDLELGNIVKANRFGYVKQACHGSRPLDYEELRAHYARTIVDLGESRWVFLNTFFSISEACMYAGLVDRLDAGAFGDVVGYAQLYAIVKRNLDAAHMEGELKAEIMADPDRFVVLDPEVPITLLDQLESGKRLMVITNSGWPFTKAMMTFAFDRYLPGEMTWRDLFELVIVSARKPLFFSGPASLYEVVDEERGLLSPRTTGIHHAGVYVGGHAGQVESWLRLSGSDILYVGDHIYGDVNQSKKVRRWRSALIVRELEDELAALASFAPQQERLSRLMADKVALERELARVKLRRQRLRRGHPGAPGDDPEALRAMGDILRARIEALDGELAPLAMAHARLHNPRWGLLMRAGNDKSHMARQVERHADIYTSRVSNLLHATPYAYVRSPRGSLPHDPGGWR